MKRRQSMSPPRSPKPSRSPRGTRASTRSPRSPNASLVRGSDPDHNRSNPKIDPDEESLAAARRSSRTKKSSQDVNDSTHEDQEHHSPDRSMNGGGASGSDLPARRTRSSDGYQPSNRRNSSPILPGKYLTAPNHHSPPKQNGRIVDHDSEEEAAAESRRTRRGQSDPYYNNHVRFSPSAKLSSPARYREGRSRRKAADDALHKVRLQNVPSEDEQKEFNRRYSRDLQKRRSQNLRGDKDETEEEEEKSSRSSRLHNNDNYAERSSSRRKREEEESTPLSLSLRRRSTRATAEHHEEADHESESDVNGDVDETPKSETRRRGPVREAAARNLRYDDHVTETSEDDAAKDGRRNGRRNASKSRRESSAPASLNSTQNEAEGTDEEEASALNSSQIRRSSRISTKKEIARARETSDVQTEDSSEDSSESSEESDVVEKKKSSSNSRRDGRPKRKRAPVERLSYENPQVRHRRHREEHYSSEDESIREKKDRVVRRKSAKARIRRKSRPRPANMRDSSLSSSSDTSSDEERFKKRKNKRMMIELSKLRPMNMDKKDVTKSIFRDRTKIGSSCADVSPMEVDLKTTFKNVGGRADHINCLKEIVVLPLLYPEIFSKFNITPPRGVLFHGPPGTGKTLLARALAAECSHEGRKVAFFMRKGADVLNKWIGESERQLRLLFDQAYVMRPSIIFFDEIDGLAPVRSSRQDQIHSSIVSTLLALIDGLDNRGEVIVIGATNRVENIDPALRRPGRFDRELRFDLPTRDARREILHVHTRSWKPAIPTRLLDILADKTIGYSGADLKGLCAEAVLRSLRRRYPQVYTTNQKLGLDTEQVVVMEDDFVSAMSVMVPSTLRVNDQHQMPLPTNVKPLLENTVANICTLVDKKQHLSFQPRVLISGFPYQSLSTYIGPAVLHHLEKLPKHILDLPSLYSNSARSPEENLCQIFHEARRTVPCVLYIPRLKELYMSDSLRMAFHSLLASVQPTSPLLVLAIAEYNDSAEEPALDSHFKQIFSEDEIFRVTEPTEEERIRFYEPVFEAALAPPIKEAEPFEVTVDELEVVPLPESRELTENEEKRLRKKEDALLRELRIFLRDIWHKINREKGFFMFRQPVDTTEVDDYLDVIKTPMDFDKMLYKLDNGDYSSAQSFLDDIDLIAENAIEYNGDPNYETNKVICHRARALQDFAYALVKAEMDTDFEDECKEIVARRKQLTKKLKEPPVQPITIKHHDPNDVTRSTTKKRPAKKRTSGWARGVDSSRKRKKVNHLENGNVAEKSVNGVSGDEDKDHSNNEMSGDEDGSGSEASASGSIQIDSKKLNAVKKDLVGATSSVPTEKLERIFVMLMSCVNAYKAKLDRRQLPDELQDVVKTARRIQREMQETEFYG